MPPLFNTTRDGSTADGGNDSAALDPTTESVTAAGSSLGER